MDNMQGGQSMCKCPHHKVVPILVILFGLAFLLEALGIIITKGGLSIIWPILVIIGGAMKLTSKMCKCC